MHAVNWTSHHRNFRWQQLTRYTQQNTNVRNRTAARRTDATKRTSKSNERRPQVTGTEGCVILTYLSLRVRRVPAAFLEKYGDANTSAGTVTRHGEIYVAGTPACVVIVQNWIIITEKRVRLPGNVATQIPPTIWTGHECPTRNGAGAGGREWAVDRCTTGRLSARIICRPQKNLVKREIKLKSWSCGNC